MSAMSMSSGEATSPAARHAADDGFDVLDDCHRRMLAVIDALANLVEVVESKGAGADERAAATGERP